MHFLKCNNCGHLNEVKTQYLVFCANCDKKLENNYAAWIIRYPDKNLDDFKQLMCVSEDDIQKTVVKPKKAKQIKGLKYWVSFTVLFAIFYAIGQFGGEKLFQIFRKPAFDKAMVEFASEINKNCPIQIDNATRLDNVIALPNNTFQYNYTILTMVKDSIKIDELKNYLEPRIINNVKTEPQMQLIRDKKITVNYSYKDKSGIFLFMIPVKPEQYE